MKFWVGVTDNAWFSFLSQAAPDEVNFWQPRGAATYTGLESGTPFLFKLKRPYHHVAGGGYFVKSTSLPLSVAWEAFGQKNGAAQRGIFEKMIRSLLADPAARDPEIGCTVLAQPFFWPRGAWIPDPIDFSSNIVRGRYYDTTEPSGGQLLLRSDFHKLFDIGLVTITPSYRIEVSSRIREEWFNGKAYYRLHGQPLPRLPEDPAHRPGAAYLRWHNENRYVG